MAINIFFNQHLPATARLYRVVWYYLHTTTRYNRAVAKVTGVDADYYFLLELDKTTGEIIDRHNFITPFESGYAPESLTYDVSTNEIYGIRDRRIVKYNITTKAETFFSLPENFFNMSDIIVVNTSNTGINENSSQSKASKSIRAYNILGIEVPLNTTNQMIIIEYENGLREKVYRK